MSGPLEVVATGGAGAARLLSLEEQSRAARLRANDLDRQIAARLIGDLEAIAKRCAEMGDFLGVPDMERSELRQIGTLIKRGLEAVMIVRERS